MVLLDSKVLSEIMAATQAPQVANRAVKQQSEELFAVAVWQPEILADSGVLPSGRRRLAPGEAGRAVFSEEFQGRILPFDSQTDAAYANVFASCRKVGTIDLMVAFSARVHDGSAVKPNVAGLRKLAWQSLTFGLISHRGCLRQTRNEAAGIWPMIGPKGTNKFLLVEICIYTQIVT